MTKRQLEDKIYLLKLELHRVKSELHSATESLAGLSHTYRLANEEIAELRAMTPEERRLKTDVIVAHLRQQLRDFHDDVSAS